MEPCKSTALNTQGTTQLELKRTDGKNGRDVQDGVRPREECDKLSDRSHGRLAPKLGGTQSDSATSTLHEVGHEREKLGVERLGVR